MTDLTDKWKKGELEDGWYYVLLFSNEEYITFIDGNWVVDDSLIEADIKEVLAPVPSYEEWQLMQDDNKRLKHDVGNLGYKIKNQRKEIERQIAQNIKLKELLKDARNVLKMVDTYSGNYDSINGFLIVERINQALGEDK